MANAAQPLVDASSEAKPSVGEMTNDGVSVESQGGPGRGGRGGSNNAQGKRGRGNGGGGGGRSRGGGRGRGRGGGGRARGKGKGGRRAGQGIDHGGGVRSHGRKGPRIRGSRVGFGTFGCGRLGLIVMAGRFLARRMGCGRKRKRRNQGHGQARQGGRGGHHTNPQPYKGKQRPYVSQNEAEGNTADNDLPVAVGVPVADEETLTKG